METNKSDKHYWIDGHRFLVIIIILMIMWAGVMGLFYFKADEVTKHPCEVCAKKMGEDVTCMTSGGFGTIPNSITFYANESGGS